MTSFLTNAATLNELGWQHIRDALSARTGSALGRERVAALAFLNDDAAVDTSLARIEEVRTLLRKEIEVPISGVDDVRPQLDRVEKGAALSASELLAIARVSQTASSVRAFGRSRVMEAPLVGGQAQQVANLGPIGARIDEVLEPSGTVRDNASDQLLMYRTRARALHQQIRVRIDELIADPSFAENMRDTYFSTRNDRYVLPINASFRARVPGIVHNASQSGQTIFVEPEQIIGMGNELAIAESLAAEEERRVLGELSEDVAGQVDNLRAAQAIFAELDFTQAAARLANALDASVPVIVPPSRTALKLRNVRHPVLVLQGKKVVGNTLDLSAEQLTLVVSGPNAGGKTVTITAAGLCALMLRAGLPVPADDGSEMPLTRGVLSVIGDAQDMGRDLSSFSAHVTRLRDVLDVARAGVWVLVDEIAADTDPREGAALATAVLEHLAEHDARTFVTTHLEEVKSLGITDPRFVNARVGLDAATLRPTYRVELGAAGMSNALDVAAQIGLPAAVLEKARERVAKGSQISLALSRLETLERTVVDERERARVALAEAQAERERAAVVLRDAEQQREEARAKAREEVLAELEAQRAEMAQLIAKVQGAPDMREAQRLQRELEARAARMREEQQRASAKAEIAHVAIPEKDLKVGLKVRVLSLGRDGEVVSLEPEHATVAVGVLKTRVKRSDLVPVGGKNSGAAPKTQDGLRPRTRDEKARAARGGGLDDDAPQTELDIRGRRAEDAMSALTTFLDALYLKGASRGTIIHGHGTGALKEAIRDVLRLSPYVESFRPGDRGEGGDGATIVDIKT
jgi:DNA mismatch repair protein MutS2